MKAEKLFQLEDKWLKLPGLYIMWTFLYVANLYVLLSIIYVEFTMKGL